MWLDVVSRNETAAQCELIAPVKAFHVGGWKAVMVDRPSRPVGTGRTLTAEQEREVQRLIRGRRPHRLKMVHALWTRQVGSRADPGALRRPTAGAHDGPVPEPLGLHAV